MKEVLLFIMRSCPHCKKALAYQQELFEQYPAFLKAPLCIVDENEEADFASRYAYYYVPTYYVDGKKMHEGPVSKEDVKAVFESAMGK